MSTPDNFPKPVPPPGFETISPEDLAGIPRQDPSAQRMKRILQGLIGRWYWIALGGILGLLGATYYLSKAPKQYTSTATLLIKHYTVNVMNGTQRQEVDLRSQEGMNTVAESIRRMDLLERVASRQDVRDLQGLIPAPVDWTPAWLQQKLGRQPKDDQLTKQEVPPPAVLAGMLSGWMKPSIRRYTRLMDISVTHPVPEVSAALSNAIMRDYLKEIDDDRDEGEKSALTILENESSRKLKALQADRTAFATYRRALDLHTALEAKENEVLQLERRYKAKHPKMIAASGELASLVQRFTAEFKTAQVTSTDSNYWSQNGVTLPNAEANPDEYLRAARQQLLARTEVLQNEVNSSTDMYNDVRGQKDVSEMNHEGKESNAKVHGFARVPGPPSSPNNRKIMGTGFSFGLGAGLLFALLLGRIDNKFHTVAQIASETGTSVLASIAEIKPRQLASAERDYLKRTPEAPAEAFDPWDDMLLFKPSTSSTVYSEMFRVLRTSITLLGDETRRKITLFSSALPGEGKSSISANFALAAAAQGRKTLLIDLDLRKPYLHRLFGMPRRSEQGGITDCLANKATLQDVTVKVPQQDNLHLVLSGNRAPNPGELLDTGRLRAILHQAAREYDVVVLDTAPLLSVPDTRVIAPLAHNFCLVVRAEYTPKSAVYRVLKVLDEDRTALSGVVVNGFKEKRRLIGENYSYGYYRTSASGRSVNYGYGSYGTYGEDDDDDQPVRRKNRKRSRA